MKITTPVNSLTTARAEAIASMGLTAKQYAESLRRLGAEPDAVASAVEASGRQRHFRRIDVMAAWLEATGRDGDALGPFALGCAVVAHGVKDVSRADVPFAGIVPVPPRRGAASGVFGAALGCAIRQHTRRDDGVCEAETQILTAVAFVAVVGTREAASAAQRYLGERISDRDYRGLVNCSLDDTAVFCAVSRVAAELRAAYRASTDSAHDTAHGEWAEATAQAVEDGTTPAPKEWGLWFLGLATDVAEVVHAYQAARAEVDPW